MSSQLKTQGIMGRMEDRSSIRSISTWVLRMRISKLRRRHWRAIRARAASCRKTGWRPYTPARPNTGGRAAVLKTKMKMTRRAAAGAPSPRSGAAFPAHSLAVRQGPVTGTLTTARAWRELKAGRPSPQQGQVVEPSYPSVSGTLPGQASPSVLAA
jgi:hypothetical protein